MDILKSIIQDTIRLPKQQFNQILLAKIDILPRDNQRRVFSQAYEDRAQESANREPSRQPKSLTILIKTFYLLRILERYYLSNCIFSTNVSLATSPDVSENALCAKNVLYLVLKFFSSNFVYVQYQCIYFAKYPIQLCDRGR